MPLIKVDVIRGKDKEYLKKVLDNIHNSMVEAFGVPNGDRYQILTQHDKDEMIIEDTGLGFTRSDNVIVISVTSKNRTQEQKTDLYSLIVSNLEKNCGIAPNDVMISIMENTTSDWSFGFGRAQFLTGEL